MSLQNVSVSIIYVLRTLYLLDGHVELACMHVWCRGKCIFNSSQYRISVEDDQLIKFDVNRFSFNLFMAA